MFPPKYYAEVGLQEFSQKPIGTGPFMLDEWVHGDRIVLVKNPNYWRDGYPLLDKITFRPITNRPPAPLRFRPARSTLPTG